MNTWIPINRRTGFVLSPAFLLGLLLLFSLGVAQLQARNGWPSNRRTPCVQVAYKAFTSDLIEAVADYTLAKAKAINIDDDEEREESLEEAMEDYREDRMEAVQQLIARLELCRDLGEDRYYPDIDPENFCTPEEIAANPNPYFMLIPGRVMVYGGEVEEDDGEIVEDTRDWFAQDKDGNVWYFGEISLNYEDGQISDIDGSWKAGEDGALPGILVFAEPEVGRTHRQEYLLGEAEDVAKPEAVGVTVVANEIEYADCVQTLEYTPLEADSFEYKYAQAGVGVVLEESIESGEKLELLAINPE